MSNELTTFDSQQRPAQVSIFNDMAAFDDAQRICKVLASSDLVPKMYKGNIGNCLVALEMAQRIGASPLMVMQNLDIIQGRPSFKSSFLIATANTCGRFSPLVYTITKLGKKKIDFDVWVGDQSNRRKEKRQIEIIDFECFASAKDLRTGETLEGPRVTCEMAVREGWWTKTDSKWPNMTDLMLRYRAAAFFVRTYSPELSMGMRTSEEYSDADVLEITTTPLKSASAAALSDDPGQSSEQVVVVGQDQNDESETIIPENSEELI